MEMEKEEEMEMDGDWTINLNGGRRVGWRGVC